jgi:carbamoyl-phosphate synthase small subunit
MSRDLGITEGQLVLADGEVFEGELIGAMPTEGVAAGEVVFNTALSGYQEIITDPSYAGQIITFTYPHIGNYGMNDADNEGRKPFCRGIIIRDLARRMSNHRATEDLDSFLASRGVCGIAGVDTRRLTRHIRTAGAIPGAFGTADVATLRAAAEADGGTDGRDSVAEVTCDEPYLVPGGPKHVVAYDFGIKSTILTHLSGIATVEVVPASTPAAEVLARNPDGVFLSNGPGDPAPLSYARENIAALLGEVPVFGICLGHQLLAGALGGDTFKLPFGHHGGNHPVRRVDVAEGTAEGQSVEITSQNHNYAVVEGSVPSADITHINLNDGTIEGLRSTAVPAFSVQYHPEAGPGPHDSQYLFTEFNNLIEATNGVRS